MSETTIGQTMIDVAARQRRIAHYEPNHIQPGESIYGWNVQDPLPDEEPDDDEDPRYLPREGQSYSRVTKAGWVRHDDAVELRDATMGVPERMVDREPWVLVDDLVRYLVHRERLSDWETKLVFTYTCDVLPDGRTMRHLSVQMSVPGIVTTGELNVNQDLLLGNFEPIVKLYFPMHPAVAASMRAAAPVPIVNNAQSKSDAVIHHRTPVLADFFVDHNANAVLPPPEPRKKVRLLGPDGRPL